MSSKIDHKLVCPAIVWYFRTIIKNKQADVMKMSQKIFLWALLSCASMSSWATDPFTVELYQTSCGICHASGAGGAPKSFDVAAWAERLEKGEEVLLNNAIAGYKGMPPLGMCSDCTKEDLVDLIDYMAKEQAQ
jgi:cytochrome c5